MGVQLAGTVSDPRAVVTAERPGLGIGLANLVAKINCAPNGYRLAATGDTDYGPLSADVVLLMAAGPLTIDVERGDLAGIGFNGRSEERRVGKECVSTCRSRWSPYQSKKKHTKLNKRDRYSRERKK